MFWWHTCTDTAHDGTHEMRVEDFECIVNLAEELCASKYVHGNPRDGAGTKAQENGTPASNHTGSRRDGYQASDHTLNGANHGWFLEKDHIHHHPGQQTGRGADVGVEHGHAGIGTRSVRITSVEAVPSGPENTSTTQHERNVARFGVDAIDVETGADPPGAHESGRARRQVDDIATGVIDHAHLEEETSAPDAEGADGVGKCEPERHEEHPRGEIHAAEVRSRDEDEGDGGKDELEIDHGRLREILAEAGGRQGGLLQLVGDIDRDARVADEGQHLKAEAHSVPPQHPAQEDHGEGVEGHEGGIDGPLVFDPAGIENDQAGDTLERDQTTGGQLPGVVAAVQPGRGGEVGRIEGVVRRTRHGGKLLCGAEGERKKHCWRARVGGKRTGVVLSIYSEPADGDAACRHLCCPMASSPAKLFSAARETDPVRQA